MRLSRQLWQTRVCLTTTRRSLSSQPSFGSNRSGKRVSTVPIHELPQGLLPLEPRAESSDESGVVYPAVLQQTRNNMRRFEHCVLLTRVGNFYELYFEQAVEYSSLLNLKLATKKTNAGPVPMAGFPFFQLERFLKMLVQDLNKHVAISEEIRTFTSDSRSPAAVTIDREVKRVITPGTLIDEHFLNQSSHNYLLAVHVQLDGSVTSQHEDMLLHDAAETQVGRRNIGLSWLDLSSGDFFTQSVDMPMLSSAITRIGPREVVLDKKHQRPSDSQVLSILDELSIVPSFYDISSKIDSSDDWKHAFEDETSSINCESFKPEESLSASLLVRYVKSQLPGFDLKLQKPQLQQVEDFMNIDKNTMRSLEITKTLRDGTFKGSLLHTVRKTVTESGSRLLAQRLTSPSMSISVINDRLDLVEALLNDRPLLEDMIGLLSKTNDVLRIVQKFSLGRGDADDLLALAKTVLLTKDIDARLHLSTVRFGQILNRLSEKFELDDPLRLAKRINQVIDQEGLLLRQRSQEIESIRATDTPSISNNHADSANVESSFSEDHTRSRQNTRSIAADRAGSDDDEIWVMRPIASPALDRLHQNLIALHSEKAVLAQTLRSKLAAASLTLRMTPGLGHICHMKGKDVKKSLSSLTGAKEVGSSKSTRSFYLPEWTQLGSMIEEVKLRIRTEEQNIFNGLREEVMENLTTLRRNAVTLDELDVACSFSQLATEFGLRRPVLNDSYVSQVWGGRHMTVEAGLIAAGRNFTPNNLNLTESERTWLITGPNMAGKSTFLRQSALISILAQTGSFVPAEFAEIGLVDQIFSRVGSADNLSQDQSTFMVEMLETAHILRHATRRSFVIVDEVGRGTTPEDGTAVGLAVLHHLHKVNRCRTLFATHFHALADLTKDFDGLTLYCTTVVEEDSGAFRYDHRLRKGINREPHAIKVARLAGMPDLVVEIAAKFLQQNKSDNAGSCSK